ncbi:hypothetical protein BKA67DRAFT_554522 [Truncatella angustata]|uniref:Clr5 domain-containing protein n=1 Tax=Truncatella angustata TaxID=152316 RepID=A0A9P9A1I2_9PEZI|nr:uncharacterized protein BKA67DRAFT_554522 [Truncatella angustata]KAH6657186.1 hypothetical protein BKA67DRAFT_554522 [Truncatella angustata]
MVYNWDMYEPKCYRLYIDENKSLEDIMDIMRVEDNFTPSKRAYQTQFRRWKFPSKQNPAHKDDRLVARVKELWEKNLSQREILRMLNDEDGFDIKHRELMRVRTRNRWLLRKPNPDRPSREETAERPPDDIVTSRSQYDLSADNTSHSKHLQPQQRELVQDSVNDEPEFGKPDWQDKPRAVGAETQGTRKGRQRGRVRPGMSLGSPGQPRFPSETTIDESRVILKLDAKQYQHMRTSFARICGEEGVIKKTIAGPERWESVKGRLVQEMAHLQSVIWANTEGAESRRLALDVICTDVTKRMRSMEYKLTITDAKAVLGINPEEYRIIRQDFASVLRQDQFKSKTEAGPEHWEALQEKWRANSVILRRVLTADDDDHVYHNKLRAIDVVARDVMKRLRDGRSKDNQHKPRTPPASKPAMLPTDVHVVLANGELGPEAINSRGSDNGQEIGITNDFASSPRRGSSHLSTTVTLGTPHASNHGTGHGSPHAQREHLPPPREAIQQHQGLANTLSSDSLLSNGPTHHPASLLPDNVLSSALPIDPEIGGAISILLNGQGQALGTQHAQSPFPLAQDLASNVVHPPHAYVPNPYGGSPSAKPPIAVYLRWHHSSPINVGSSVWIVTLRARTFEELRHVAVKELPGMVCGRVVGILDESVIEVSRDDELTAYLAVLEGRSSAGMPGSPCFYVQILPGGWKA